MLNLFNSQKKKRIKRTRKLKAWKKKPIEKWWEKKDWKRGSWDMQHGVLIWHVISTFPWNFFLVFFVILLADSHLPTWIESRFVLSESLMSVNECAIYPQFWKVYHYVVRRVDPIPLVHMLPNYHSFVVKYKIFLNRLGRWLSSNFI